jgi:hypothetical protein
MYLGTCIDCQNLFLDIRKIIFKLNDLLADNINASGTCLLLMIAARQERVYFS